MTVDEYARLPEHRLFRDELVHGRLVREPPPTAEHGWLVIRLGRYLVEHVERHAAGYVTAESGFVLSEEPPTVRGPDLAFIARDRVPGFPTAGFPHLAPDLAVEILSPSDRMSSMQAKVLEYLDAGTRLVWVVDPAARIATVYRSRSDVRVLRIDEELDGEAVLPGFRLALASLFARG